MDQESLKRVDQLYLCKESNLDEIDWNTRKYQDEPHLGKKFSFFRSSSERLPKFEEEKRKKLAKLDFRKIEEIIIPKSSCGIIKIQIIDTGIGISQENISKLFQPFIQTQSAQ